MEHKDKAKLKSIWRSIKKFFLRYVLLVSIFYFKHFFSDPLTHMFVLQMIFLIAMLFLVVEVLQMFQRGDEKFYYLLKMIGVGY
jgi:hypothetical protein